MRTHRGCAHRRPGYGLRRHVVAERYHTEPARGTDRGRRRRHGSRLHSGSRCTRRGRRVHRTLLRGRGLLSRAGLHGHRLPTVCQWDVRQGRGGLGLRCPAHRFAPQIEPLDRLQPLVRQHGQRVKHEQPCLQARRCPSVCGRARNEIRQQLLRASTATTRTRTRFLSPTSWTRTGSRCSSRPSTSSARAPSATP